MTTVLAAILTYRTQGGSCDTMLWREKDGKIEEIDAKEGAGLSLCDDPAFITMSSTCDVLAPMALPLGTTNFTKLVL